MDLDLPGRIKHTQLLHSDALLPLFEAIINSIHSINELKARQHGVIHVRISRDHTQEALSFDNASKSSLLPIKSFAIEDNGVGFTDVNFKSFGTADSQQKSSIGGKGVGRFLWLKAFDHAQVVSTYTSDDGNSYKRTFSLRLSPRGVEDHANTVSSERERKTVVELCEIRSEYREGLPHNAETIAKKIVEHCLEYFVLGTAPYIHIHDSDSDTVISLNELFEEQIRGTSSRGEFKALRRHFNIHNLRVSPSYQSTHRLYFCADDRSVKSINLAGRVPDLPGSLREDSGRPFVYAGYISGQYLDESVNSERTDFVIPIEDTLGGSPGWTTLLQNAIDAASTFLSTYTTSVRTAKEQQIAEFVRYKAPQYRAVVKHRKDLVDRIPPDLPEEKLDLELYKIDKVYETDLREKVNSILTSLQGEPDDWEKFRDKYSRFLEEWNESGIAKLARHMVHRKATLDFLKASLKVSDSGKYRLENSIHQIIFPLKKTSDDVRPEQMNLWILDEKLAYHYYLASDIRFDKQEINLPSADRADIIIFNGTAAFVNDSPPFSSIVLIEFKRPVRDDYTDEDNPIVQIYGYTELIKSGKAKDRAGRPILIKPETPIYAYLICDLTPTLARQAKFASLSPTPDGLGYFGFNPQLGVLVEIMSFDKLVSDAERRNAAHFDQLNLPTT
jgi:hypothetical protein